MGEGFQYLDIIIFAMIAVVLVMRLRSMLGRRTGHERQRDPFATRRAEEKSNDKVIPLPDRNRPPRGEEPVDIAHDPLPTPRGPATPASGSEIAGIDRIRAADGEFTPEGFLVGARAAFEIVVTAYAAGDSAALRPLLSDEVFDKFNSAITARAKAKETLQTTLVGITSADVLEGDVRGREAVVTVKFVSEQINVTRDSEGRVIDGDPSTVSTVTDIWTFSRNLRSRDPNWTLVATRSPN
jgi:predicted lipid-binding transport protein (Tim44 family)